MYRWVVAEYDMCLEGLPFHYVCESREAARRLMAAKDRRDADVEVCRAKMPWRCEPGEAKQYMLLWRDESGILNLSLRDKPQEFFEGIELHLLKGEEIQLLARVGEWEKLEG